MIDARNGSIDCRETRHHFVAELVGVDGTGERDDSPILPSMDHNNLKLGTIDVHFPETSCQGPSNRTPDYTASYWWSSPASKT